VPPMPPSPPLPLPPSRIPAWERRRNPDRRMWNGRRQGDLRFTLKPLPLATLAAGAGLVCLALGFALL